MKNNMSSFPLNSRTKTLTMTYDATLNTDSDAQLYFNNLSVNQNNLTWSRRCINLFFSYPPFGSGGIFYVESFKGSENYEWQTATTYHATLGRMKFARSKIGGTWNEWIAV